MTKTIFIVLAVMVLILVSSVAGEAWGPYYRGGGWHGYWHGPRYGGGVWIGPGWGPWWGPPAVWTFPYAYYAAPPVVVERSPPVFVQPAPQPEETFYWYYCQSPRGYYPYIRQCPGGWTKVAPSPDAPDW